MCADFSFLKANTRFALYWYRETAKSNPIFSFPKEHPYRSVFACDRDRVMYSSAFRNLSSKTQVFNSQAGDNLRTRLTHTLEVSQIARTIAKNLGFDEDLTEAIALGHDVGHTPFGHIGERTLNTFSHGKDKSQTHYNDHAYGSERGFKHNLQSVRVLVEYSENVKFSNYMLFGIKEHSKLYWKKPEDVSFYDIYEKFCSYSDGTITIPAWSFEAFIVKWADEVAQRHHDIEDAFLQKIMPAEDIVEKVRPLNEITNDDSLSKKIERLKSETERLSRRDFTSKQFAFAHTLSSFLVDVYVTVLIKEFSRVLNHFCNIHKIRNRDDFQNQYLSIPIYNVREIMQLETSKISCVDKILGQSLKYSILDSYEVQRMDGKGAYIIRKLIRAFISNPQQLPNDYINRFVKIEIVRLFSEEKLKSFLKEIRKQLAIIPENINIWKDYECQEVLRLITNNDILSKDTYPALLRTIFDYVSSMTDSSATLQRIELY